MGQQRVLLSTSWIDPFPDPNVLRGRLLLAIPKKGALPLGFHTRYH
jgi:hypothetical protein